MPKKRTQREVPIYQLKITLKEIEPPIFRIVQIKANANIAKVHDYLQGAMGAAATLGRSKGPWWVIPRIDKGEGPVID